MIDPQENIFQTIIMEQTLQNKFITITLDQRKGYRAIVCLCAGLLTHLVLNDY
jgi:hypothetical protein